MKNTVVLAALVVALFAALPAAAGGGYGSVWVVETTENSITIDWSPPSGDFRSASSPLPFEICFKEADDWRGSCAHGTVVFTSTRPYEIQGLTPEESYKIKVYAFTEKKWRGKYRNPSYRKVGTLTQTTRPVPVPTEPSGHIEMAGAAPSSATVRVHWSELSLLEEVFVCYKRNWWTSVTLDSGCTSWFLPNPDYGWVGAHAPFAGTAVDVEIGNLADCRQYSFQAYGFYPGGVKEKIGDTIKGHTGASCKTSLVGTLLDADDLLAGEYLNEVEAFYGSTLADHVLDVNPHLGREHFILEASGENVSAPLVLLEYLTEAHPEVVDAWQAEEPLRDAGLAVEQFLDRRDPGLLAVLEEDLAVDHLELGAGGRFEVSATWRTADGTSGGGSPVALTADTGYFWFFDPGNVELVVKVLDACVPFDRFWVFAAGLTNVAVEVTVLDTATGATFDLSSPQGVPFQPVQATDAFATCP